jgi:hypothetical protein
MMFLHGNRKLLSGKSWVSDPPQKFVTDVQLLDAWKLPAVEDLKVYEKFLDQIFDASRHGSSTGQILTRNGVSALEMDIYATPTISGLGEDLPYDWQIKFLRSLPEGFNDPDQPAQDIVCLLYRVSGTAPPRSFEYGDARDYWAERINSACRRLYFDVSPTNETVRMEIQDCEVGLEITETKLPDEESQSSGSLQKHGRIDYPIQSAVYKINWESMRVRVRTRHLPQWKSPAPEYLKVKNLV